MMIVLLITTSILVVVFVWNMMSEYGVEDEVFTLALAPTVIGAIVSLFINPLYCCCFIVSVFAAEIISFVLVAIMAFVAAIVGC